MSKTPGQMASPCHPVTQDASYGTFGSTTMAVHANDVQLVGFTVANDVLEKVKDGKDYPPGAGESGGAQGVALSLKGDRIHLKNMRLIGHQDTLFTDRAGPIQGRVLVQNSMITGDVDFVNVSKKASFITPVPGGVGPMTIASLLKNTLIAAKKLV
jgi:pectin methylesterase-like acyl-CoA thioesterase